MVCFQLCRRYLAEKPEFMNISEDLLVGKWCTKAVWLKIGHSLSFNGTGVR